MKFSDLPYQHEEAGLHFNVMKKVNCPTCGPTIVNDEVRACGGCGWEYKRLWGKVDEAGWRNYITQCFGRSNLGNEFNNGWEIFMLPKQGDPENRTAYSVADMENKMRRTNLNQDGMTTWDNKPPRYLSPDERSPW